MLVSGAGTPEPIGDGQVGGADQSVTDESLVQQDESAAPQLPADAEKDTVGTDADPAVSPDAPSGDEALDAASSAPIDDAFVKLGSLDEGGWDRYLVTINQNGGTIHQLELNYREANGKLRYRDMVFNGGYLGSFNTVNTDGNLTVVAVGNKTPADAAGLQKEDVIVSLDGEPVIEQANIDQWLDQKTKPGQEVKLGIKRNGVAKTLTATLVDKPVSLIQPDGELVDPNFDFPESFVFSVIKPGEVHKRWPDLDDKMREGRWQVTDASTDQMVELRYDLSAEQLAPLDIQGPLVVFKRYQLPKLDKENLHELDSRTFHLRLEIEIKNESDAMLDLAYQLNGPTGTSAETWWYANKIHGRQSAIGYTAGARDVVGGTASNSYVFWGNPEIVKDAMSSSPKSKRICDPLSTVQEDRQLKFAGVDSHYFNVSLIPDVSEGQFYDVNSVEAYPNNRMGVLPAIPKDARLQRLVDCTFQMVAPASVPANGSFKQSFDVFCGPKEVELLDDYGLSDTRIFGWFGWCSIVLLEVLHFLYYITFQTSYGLAIILLTVLVRCLMIPFSRKAALNAQMMQHLSPQVKEINDLYKDDMEKRSKATQDLYKKYKFNPLSGCFMMFFQLPIFYGLYKALNVDIALRDQPLIPGVEWCSNLAAPDQLLNWESWMPAFLADETGFLGPFLNILPILTMVLFIMQQRLFTPPPTDDQQKMMQKMMTYMMLFMGFMFFKVPAGLCLYFITSSLWGIIERKLLPKPKLDTDKFAAIDGDVPKRVPSKKQVQQSMKDEAAKLAESEERRLRNADRKKRLKNRGK